MKNITEEQRAEEQRDNILGGFAIILLGILLSSSAIWGLVDDVYSMNSGFLPIIFIILGIGSIVLGAPIAIRKPEEQQLTFGNEKTGVPSSQET